MARYPKATWKPLPEADREPIIRPTQVICHTAVSGAASLFGFFSRDDVDVESHFYVNQTAVEQYIDTGRQADANRTANARAISIETWDDGDPDHTPWTGRQLDLLAELIAWCCRTHDIPPLKCQRHDAPGIGWHSMWGAPSPWTPVAGKTCPAGPRIAQMPALIARTWALVNEEDDMTPAQAEMLANIEQRSKAMWRLLTDEGNIGRRSKETTIAVRALLSRDPTVTLSGEDRAELAELIAADIPDDLAESVIDALHRRTAPA